ncbi:MAG: DNRLRE domain-containing protein [Ruminococcaceae bacterium]|nr:DNRLRE domain-containing protein [Oscillospiraceae bacterium]
MKNKRIIKLIAFVLLLCMMFSTFSANVYALTDGAEKTTETDTDAAEVEEVVSEDAELLEPIIVSEDVSKRGENEKHFICDDGSYIAVSYPEAVHEQVNGEWVDIEYDVEAGGDGISPVDDSIKVKFANSTNSAKLVKLETGEYKISWTVEAETENGDATEKVKLSKEAKATLKTNKEITKENKEKIKNEAKYTKEEVKSLKEQTKEKIKSLQKNNTVDIAQNEDVIATNLIIEDHNREQIQSVSFAQSNVEYVGAFGKGTALRYVMTPGKINEEIVLEAYNGFKSYSMVIDTDGLTPVKTESGRVNLTDEKGETVVTIAAPFMYDSAEKHSFDVDVTVTRESKKSWRITYTPDKEWLTDEARVYPVVIDPTVTTNQVAYQNIIDAYVYTGQNSVANFDDHYLGFGYDNNTEYISYIRIMNLPAFPNGAKLTGAGLVMKFTEETAFYQNIGVYSTLGNIDATSLTWSNKPAVDAFLDNQGSIPGSLWITFCSKSFGSRINNAYSNGTTTLTYAIKFTQKKQGLTYFYSANAPSVNDRPYFTIRYTTEFSDVTEGKYYIRNVKSGLYLNVRNNSTVAGSQVTQMDYSAEPSQIWEIDKVGTDTYYIIPQNATNLKLYAPDSGSVIVSDIDYIRNQWRFSRVGGQYTISTVNQPWVVLDVDGQSMNEGATIYPYAYHGQTNQQWELIELDTVYETRAMNIGDSYNLNNISLKNIVSCVFYEGISNVVYNEDSKKIIAKNPGTVVVGIICEDMSMYQLTINILESRPLEDGIYYIKNYFSEKYIDLTNHGILNGTSVNQWGKIDNVYSQMWEVEYAGNGGYYIKPACDVTLKMTTSSNTSGASYQVNIWSNSIQKWAIVEYGSGLYNIIPLDYVDKALGIDPVVLNDGTSVVAQNRIYGSNNQKWAFEQIEIKPAVFLVHGRDSNSKGCWGVENSIGKGDNDHFGEIEGIDYTDVETQKIIPDTLVANHSEGGNLAAELVEDGYIPNINLFVFNYPNQDVVKNNAIRFRGYIENLITYAKNIGSVGMKQAFAINGEDYSFNIVGHSMGGLVARYYIENLGFDEHVEKLITIDTPHWGTPLADLSNVTGALHLLCDHDLADGSAMYGGDEAQMLPTQGCTVWALTNWGLACTDSQYVLTDELNYSVDRNTKYYAIAGIDYEAFSFPYEEDTGIDLPIDFIKYNQVEDYINNETGGYLYKGEERPDGTFIPGENFNVFWADDNMVSFFSQIGWSEESFGESPEKKIVFEGIYVLIDTNGGNSLVSGSLLHTKTQHRNQVIDKVLIYLN